MPFPISPGINVSEIDQTTGIPAVSVSTGAIVGTFNWGPVLFVMSESSEIQLNADFGNPDANSANTFFTATSFLSYSSDLRVVRALGSGAKNATANGSGILILNSDDYFSNVYATTATNSFAARYPGALGNSLQVVTFANTAGWTAIASNTSAPQYAIANQFNFAPNTSPFVTKTTGGALVGDEVHVAVIDALGLITGLANTVLEVFPSCSRLVDCVGPDGSSNYYKEVLYRKSKWVYRTGVPSSNVQGWDIAIAAANNTLLTNGVGAGSSNTATLSGGLDGTVSSANVVTGMGLLSDPVNVDISMLMCADGGQSVTNFATALAESRTDIVVTASPTLTAVQDPTSPATAINTYVNTLTRSSRLILDSGWKYMYDKYNDKYRWVPLNGDIAGLMARTDNQRDPWWSPAGLQRGQIKNVTKLAYNPGQTDRNLLFQNGVNPVVSFPGEGTMLFGDKTFLNYASAFDHINVRRLFIVLEKAISKASRTSLFEFNDVFTRAQFVQLVTPFLRTVKSRRGITNFKVVCDTTNNTDDVINANQFVGDIYITPNRSINFIQLNFIAVKTGVTFNTIVGTTG